MSNAVPPPPPPRRSYVPAHDPLVTEPEFVLPAFERAEELPTSVYVRPVEPTDEPPPAPDPVEPASPSPAAAPGEPALIAREPAEATPPITPPERDTVAHGPGSRWLPWTLERALIVVNVVLGVVVLVVVLLLQGGAG